MRLSMSAIAITSMFVLFSSGCTHTQLRLNTVGQSKTLTDVYEKQVLANLAMFSQNPDALPFFAVPGAGSTIVVDGTSVAVNPLNPRGPAKTLVGPLSGSRNMTESWALAPVTDSEKLQRMRCAYRHALGCCSCKDCCIDCCQLQKQWTGKEGGVCDEQRCLKGNCFKPLALEKCGRDLLDAEGEKIGHHGTVFLRVCPESYDDFTNLVLTILDYAVHEPKGLIRPVNIEEQYGKDGELEKTIMRYTATKKVTETKIDERRDQQGYEHIRPEAMPQPKSFNDPFFLEQKQQLFRGTIFPIE